MAFYFCFIAISTTKLNGVHFETRTDKIKGVEAVLIKTDYFAAGAELSR